MDFNLLRTNTGAGYDLADSDRAAKAALQTAFDLVKKSRRLGAETRLWAAELHSKIRKILWSFNQATSQKELPNLTALRKKIEELSSWETDILQVLQSYMTTTSGILNQLKALNPPLSAHQLRPFLDAIEMDRAGTMASLEPLAQKTHELSDIKANPLLRIP